MEDLIKWENTSNDQIIDAASKEILRSWKEICELNKSHPEADQIFNPELPPPILDPFAGGGAIPLEALRLRLAARASDLNPVAALINKALIELPQQFSGRSPIGTSGKNELIDHDWHGLHGFAEDVRFYAECVTSNAKQKIGHLYPNLIISDSDAERRPELMGLGGESLPVIAWLWARTVKSPNPAFSHVDVPLVSTFVLSSKKGKEAFVVPVINGDSLHLRCADRINTQRG